MGLARTACPLDLQAQLNPLGLTAALADTGTLGALLIFSRALRGQQWWLRTASPCPQVEATPLGRTPMLTLQNSREIGTKLLKIKQLK